MALHDWRAYLRDQFRTTLAQVDPGVIEEIAHQLEDCYESAIARGLSEEEAMEAVRAQAPNWREFQRDIRRAKPWSDCWQDLRFARRTLVRELSFSIAVILTLAVGIGSMTAVFGVINAVLLRPLPYKDPSRLTVAWTAVPEKNIHEERSSYANFRDWAGRNTVFENMAVFDPVSSTLAHTDEPDQIQVARASASLFEVLGVAPAAGRTFTREDESNRLRVLVLSHGLWVRRFGSSPEIVGRTVHLDGETSEVVGVMPEGFWFPDKSTQAWEPHTLFRDWDDRQLQRGIDSWWVVGRLKSATTLDQAQTEMSGIARQLAAEHPAVNAGLGIHLVPLEIQVAGPAVRLALEMLFGAVGFVLLISCANVANLMLAYAPPGTGAGTYRAGLHATEPAVFPIDEPSGPRDIRPHRLDCRAEARNPCNR